MKIITANEILRNRKKSSVGDDVTFYICNIAASFYIYCVSFCQTLFWELRVKGS